MNISTLSERVRIDPNSAESQVVSFSKVYFPRKSRGGAKRIVFVSFTATTPRCCIWSHHESRRLVIKKRVSSLHSLAKRRHTLPLFVVPTSCTAPKVCLIKRVFVDIYSTRQAPLFCLNPPRAAPRNRPIPTPRTPGRTSSTSSAILSPAPPDHLVVDQLFNPCYHLPK